MTARAPGTLGAALAAAADSPHGVTFVGAGEREESQTWQDVRSRALRTAAGLTGAGVGPGDRVALVLPTSPGFLDAFFGCLLAGAVPVPLYPPVRLGRLAEYRAATVRMLDAVAARLIVTDGRVRRLLGEVTAAAQPPLGCRTVADLRGDALASPHAVRPDDLALVQFSSGTTGDPRPVALSHAALLAQCAAMAAHLRPADATPQVGVSWLPLYHDMGLIGALLGAVTWPGPLVLIPPERFLAKPAVWLRAIARHRGTISPAPAFAFALCARKVRDEQLAGCDLSSWRVALCGAEPVVPGALEAFSARFAPYGFGARALAPAYGLAEAALGVTATAAGRGVEQLRVDAAHLRPGDRVRPGAVAVVSCGRPLAGIEVAVRDRRGRDLPPRTVGRIFTRGPSLMSGYLDQARATRAVLRGGWLDTGDLGFLAAGRLFVTGRAKDVIVIRGVNHRPDEFARAAQVEGVRPGRVAAGGFVPPDGEGEALLLLVERAPGPAAGGDGDLRARIAAAVREATGVEPAEVAVLAPGTLPRTSSGKLRRAEAVRRHLAGELSAPGRAGPWAVAGQALRSALGFVRWRLQR